MTEKIVRVNDFFCGAGGMGLGFKQAGFRLAGAWDFDKYAVESYGSAISPKVKEQDITEMIWDEVPYADTWTFGAPCQAFSVAGKGLGMTFKCPSCGHEEQFEGEMIIDRTTPCSSCGTQSKPKDPRGVLFFEIMRLLKHTNSNKPEQLPPVILLENVKGIKKFLHVVEYEYEKRGYKLSKTLYDSKYWNVPQHRERYFCIGIRSDIEKEFVFPEQQTDFVPKLSSILEENVDESYYIDDLKAAKIIEQAIEGLKVKQATKKGYDIAVEGDTINISHPNSKTRRGRVGRQIAQTLLTGQEQVVVLKDVHACITPDRVDKRQNGRRAKGNEEEMYTLTAQDLHGVILDDTYGFDGVRIYDEISPTLRSERQGLKTVEQPKIEMIGMLDMKGNETIRRVYDPEGLSPTLTTSEGGHRQPKIMVVGNTNPSGNGINGKVYNTEGIAHTVTTNKGEGHKIMHQYRVRRLTEREYARLQAFPDEVFDKMKYHSLEESKRILEKYPNHKGKRLFNDEERIQRMSKSQLYKQFGNAVTVSVSRALGEKIKEFLEEIK
jgi:DNA (cytosine-5)-methyltransferase 1